MSINVNVGTIIPTAVVEVGNEITAEQLAAITSATGASGSNPFTTATHTHIIGNVTGLQTALDGKANTAHTHIVSDVTGLQTVLDNKASVSHTHDIASISGLSSALDEKAELVHTHIIADVTGLQTALDGKLSASHNHDGVYAPVVHTHAIADVTGLQTAIDGKASTTHTHSNYAPLTGATFSGEIETPQIGNLLNAELVIDSYNDTGAGTHYYHKFTPFDGRFVLAPNGGGLVFPDTTIQSTAAYSKAQSDAHLDTVATWVATKANLSGDTFTGKVNFTPSGGVAGLNIGIGGTSTDSITAGDLWISTGGANLNFRDGTGAWRIVASTSNTNAFSAPQIIDTTATSAGLRITQKGTGHSLIVEDSTTPDSSAVVITNNGAIGVGVDPYAGPFAGDASLVVQMNDKSRAASFRRTGAPSADNGQPVVFISGFNGTTTSLGLYVKDSTVLFEDSALRIGPFGNATRASISNIQQPVIATGTYNREIAITIDGATYRIPCRLV